MDNEILEEDIMLMSDNDIDTDTAQELSLYANNVYNEDGEKIAEIYGNKVIFEGGFITAQDTSYDNTATGLTATNVQTAIDEVTDSLNNLVKYTSTKLVTKDSTYIVEDGHHSLKIMSSGSHGTMEISLRIASTIGSTFTTVGTLPNEALLSYFDGVLAGEGGYGCAIRRNGTNLEVRNATQSGIWYRGTVVF